LRSVSTFHRWKLASDRTRPARGRALVVVRTGEGIPFIQV
jgi:hypothetical protein